MTLVLALPLAFAQTDDGAVISGAGAALMGIVAFALALQPPLSTVTFSVTLPDAAAVNVIVFVPAPPVIVPLVIVHVYVAPVCDATLAFAEVDAHTEAGALIVAVGEGLIGTATLPLFVQPAVDVIVMASATLPDEAAVKVIAFVPAPALIVPLVIVQVYVTPLCDGTLAFADVDEQIDGGAVIVADGVGLIVTLALPVAEQLVVSVTVTARETLPDAPGLNVIDDVPWPLSSVPLVTLHTYVAPVVVVTLAPTFVAFAQTADGAVIVAGGGVQTNVNDPLLVAVPPPVVTEIGPLVTFVGTVAVICVELFTTNVAGVPLNETALTPAKFVPVMVTLAPGPPLVGAKFVIVGTEATKHLPALATL